MPSTSTSAATTVANATNDGVRVRLEALLAQRLAARALVLAASRQVGHSTTGQKLSRFRGRGVDYAESRVYQPGDDIRTMDWRVTARTGRPHTKVYQEERERSVLLVVDYNDSMRFGTRVRFKSVQAARAAALIAWSAVRGGDRVGAIGFGAGIASEVRPVGGPRGALHCLRALARWDEIARDERAGVPGALSEALERTRRLARPGTLVIILTDGFSTDAAVEPVLARLREHCEVRILQCTDALEMSAPPAGRYLFVHGATRRVVEFGSPSADAHWVDAFRAQRERLADYARRFGIPSTNIDTRDELGGRMAPLVLALAARRRSA
jgi:uncharacterized protein (DUF58 family)